MSARYNLRKRPEPVAVKYDPPKKKVKVIKKEPQQQLSVLVFGTDNCGELGQGKTDIIKLKPFPLKTADHIKQIACGAMHTILLTTDGKVLTFGCNDELALGRVTDSDEEAAIPKLIEFEDKVSKVTAGDSHCAVLTENFKTFVWGTFRDEHGTIGLTPETGGKPTVKPIQLLPEVEIKDIASGSNHMLLASKDGHVYSFGVGNQGQLGRIKPDQLTPSEGKPLAIDESNRELFLTPQLVNFKEVDPQRTFICDAVFAGEFTSFATNTDKKKNRLAAWGLNNFYQLGYKGQKDQTVQHVPKRSTFTCSTSMISVAGGQHHTIFLTKTGRVFAAGRHDYGMLGLDKVNSPICPAKGIDSLKDKKIVSISAGIHTSFAVDDEGKVYSWGMGGANLGLGQKDGEEEDILVPNELTSKFLEKKKVLSVSAGGSHTAIVIE